MSGHVVISDDGPTLLWDGSAPGQTVLLLNRSQAVTVLAANDDTDIPAGMPIAPLAGIVIDGAQPLYAQAIQGDADVYSILGGRSYSPSPVEIGAATGEASRGGAWLAYAENTAISLTTVAEIDLPGLTVTFVLASPRWVRIVGYVPAIRLDSASAARGNVFLRTGPSGGSIVQLWMGTQGGVNTISVLTAHLERWGPLQAGTYTYRLTANRDQGAGNIILTSTGQSPAFLGIQDLGPA